MSFLESLTLYTASQKMVAYGFISIGIVLLLASLGIFILSPTNAALWQGFKIGALVFGLMILLGGIGYLNFSGKVHNQIESEYQSNPATTLVAENERMNKVVSDYTIYQIAFSSIVFISLITILFAKPFWTGFAFPAAFLFVSVLLVEAHSKYSIDNHMKAVISIAQNHSDGGT